MLIFQPKKNEIAKNAKIFFPLSKKHRFFSFPFFIRALPKVLPTEEKKNTQKKPTKSKSKAKLTRNIPAMRITNNKQHNKNKHREKKKTKPLLLSHKSDILPNEKSNNNKTKPKTHTHT